MGVDFRHMGENTVKILTALALICLSACGAETTFKLYANDGKDEWTATAFAVGPTTLITAAHTFEHTARKGVGKTFILRDGKLERVSIEKIDYDADICVLSSAPNTDYLAFASSERGDVVARGFPGSSKTMSEVASVVHKVGKWVEIKSPLVFGMSGGPLVNGSGVIGMYSNGNKDKTRFVPVEKILEFLKK